MVDLGHFFPKLFEQPTTTFPPTSEPSPTPTQLIELPVTDYTDILRHSEEYDGKEVRVAGRIARLGFSSNRYSFYFRDRLGFLGVGQDFEIQLSRQFIYLSHDEEIGDYYFKNQYVLVHGIWNHSKYYPRLRNAQVISTGEEAQQVDQVFMDEWEALGHSYSKFPITDYVSLGEAPERYLGQRVRTVGQIQAVGENAVAWDKYFSFRHPKNYNKAISFCLQGCPPEMQQACIEGDYVVISCLVAEDNYGKAWFADCFVECVGEEVESIFNQFYFE